MRSRRTTPKAATVEAAPPPAIKASEAQTDTPATAVEATDPNPAAAHDAAEVVTPETSTDGEPTPAEKPPEVDLYDWDRTLITVTLCLLPSSEGTPDSRPVALSIHSPGEVPLFRLPVRMSDLSIDQITSLIAEYQESLPDRKEKKEERDREKAAAQAPVANRGRRSDLLPPGEHVKGTTAKAKETFNEKPISLFG